MTQKIVVTSALPYANGSIHIGHLVEYIQTDIYVRFLKLIGEDAIYICASDCHGTPIEMNAQKLGIKPEELIKKYHKEQQEDFKLFNIAFDNFHSTHSPENKKYAEEIYNKLKENGHIYTKEITSLYCPEDKRFLPDRFVRGNCPSCGAEEQYGDVCESCGSTHKAEELKNPKCSLCSATPEPRASEHYFFKLSDFSDKLKEWLDTNKELQKEIKNYVLNWIKEGLRDWDISRDGPYFGYKIPGEQDKYFYVWLDAPIGYISSTENYCKKAKTCKVEEYWQNDKNRIIHFIGKDIIYFHFLFWPAMLMGSGFSIPKSIMVHGFLTVNGEKMSKSRGTFFTAKEFSELYEPEHLRYFYASMLSKKMADVDLNFKDFQEKVNHELVSNVGNFCYRVLSFISSKAKGNVAKFKTDASLEKETKKLAKETKEEYQDLNFKEAIKKINLLSDLGNKYFQESQPWKVTDEKELAAILGNSYHIVKTLGLVLQPVLPQFSKSLRKQLKTDPWAWGDITFSGDAISLGKVEPLIHKLEELHEEKVFPFDLRVAKVVEAVEHPEADKLYVLQIDLGTEKRQLVAGIRQAYSAEELVGKHIVVVTNLKPAKLRGKKSDGMLLAAGSDARLIEAPKSKPGDQVQVKGYKISSDLITIDDFLQHKLKTKEHKVWYKGEQLHTAAEDLTSDAKDGSRVR